MSPTWWHLVWRGEGRWVGGLSGAAGTGPQLQARGLAGMAWWSVPGAGQGSSGAACWVGSLAVAQVLGTCCSGGSLLTTPFPLLSCVFTWVPCDSTQSYCHTVPCTLLLGGHASRRSLGTCCVHGAEGRGGVPAQVSDDPPGQGPQEPLLAGSMTIRAWS